MTEKEYIEKLYEEKKITKLMKEILLNMEERRTNTRKKDTQK